MLLKLLLESHAENGGNSSQLCNAVLTLLSRNPSDITQLTQHLVNGLINKDDTVESILHSNNFICTWIFSILEYYGGAKVKQHCKEVITSIKRSSTWNPNFWELDEEPEKIFKQVEKVVKITTKLLTAVNQMKWSEGLLQRVKELSTEIEKKLPGKALLLVNSVLISRFLVALLLKIPRQQENSK